MRPRDPDATTNFFQTELGKTLRIDETDEGRDQSSTSSRTVCGPRRRAG